MATTSTLSSPHPRSPACRESPSTALSTRCLVQSLADASTPCRSKLEWNEVLMSEPSTNPMRDAIQEAITENRVILFMKGNPDAPACGFSARTSAILQSMGQPFAAVDVLPDPRIRQELSAISNWPTIPQLFVDGELIGGCDIITEMYESGELQHTLGVENGAEAVPEPEPAQSAPLSI